MNKKMIKPKLTKWCVDPECECLDNENKDCALDNLKSILKSCREHSKQIAQ